MCSTVPSATEGNLHNPTFGRALGGIVEQRFLIETKEDFLDDILGFTAVIQDAKRNCEHQPRIAAEEQIQSLWIFDLEANHEFFVAWGRASAGWGVAIESCRPVPHITGNASARPFRGELILRW